MPIDDVESTSAFNRAATPELNQVTGHEERIPNMIRQDQPVPRPRPPGVGQAVDAQAFNERWRGEMETVRPLDPFDQIDANRGALVNQFNQRSDVLGQAEGQLMNADDRLAGAIDEYLAVHDVGQTPSAELKTRIQALNAQTLREEEQLKAMKDNATKLDSSLNLGDAFDQVAKQDRSSDRGRGR